MFTSRKQDLRGSKIARRVVLKKRAAEQEQSRLAVVTTHVTVIANLSVKGLDLINKVRYVAYMCTLSFSSLIGQV